MSLMKYFNRATERKPQVFINASVIETNPWPCQYSEEGRMMNILDVKTVPFQATAPIQEVKEKEHS